MSRADPQRLGDYLRHILEAIDNIQSYTAGMDLSAFMADRKNSGHGHPKSGNHWRGMQ